MNAIAAPATSPTTISIAPPSDIGKPDLLRGEHLQRDISEYMHPEQPRSAPPPRARLLSHGITYQPRYHHQHEQGDELRGCLRGCEDAHDLVSETDFVQRRREIVLVVMTRRPKNIRRISPSLSIRVW